MKSKQQPLLVPQRYYDAIGQLAELGPGAIEKLGAITTNEAITLDVDGVAGRISEAIGTSSSVSLSIIGLLMSLNDLRWERDQDADSLARDLTDALSEQASDEWKSKHLAKWKMAVPKFPSLLKPNGFFSLLRKAYDLAWNRQSIVASLQLLSDARPLYDENADAIKALVLSHTLVLRLQEGPERRALHITLDAGDVRRLRDELNRAAKKEATLTHSATSWGVPLIQLDSGY